MIGKELPAQIDPEQLNAIQRAVTDLNAEREAFESHLNQVLDDLEQLRLELVEHEQQLATAESRVTDQHVQ